MKHIVKPFSCILIITSFLFVNGSQGLGQNKLNISTGFGMPELLDIGIRYQLDQFQIGLGVGSMPIKDENMISIFGDVRYHFGGFSELSNRRPWYGRIGLNYLRDENEYLIDKYFYLNNRIGREFNISNKVGIEIDVGAMLQLSNEEIRKKPSSGWNFDFEFPVLPSLGIGLFYRL